MHFALIISIVALTIGSQATPQFNSFDLGDIIEGARNQVRNTISRIRTPFQRNDYLHRSNSPFGQLFRPNNNHDRQMSQADQELWTQCTNLFATHPQRAWQNRNPSSTFDSFSMSQPGINHPGQHPVGGLSSGWEVQQQPYAPLQQQFQERPRQPPPPDHRPGYMPPPGGPHHNDHYRPGQPSHGPESYQSNGGVCSPGIGEHGTTAASVSTAELVTDPTTGPSITKAIVQDNGNVASVTSRVVENSVSSTTEFDWDNFYIGASPDNTGGTGSIDVRGDFK